MWDIFSRPISGRASLDGVDTLAQRGAARRPCPQLSVSAGPVRRHPTGERACAASLHLLRDFSQLAIFAAHERNSADISKGFLRSLSGV